ncbi:hypothetical protein [Microbulbifer sp. SSSA005]|uniref:hypothetical protein n=1 Tax=unclassified Microbulbifer TaxID=2619833 RepID=UPI00403AD9F2
MIFEDRLISYFEQSPTVDPDAIDKFLLRGEAYALRVGLSPTGLYLVSGLIPKKNKIFVTVTDGPTETISYLIDYLSNLPDDSTTNWGDMLELESELLNEHGIRGLFFSRLRFFEFFDNCSDVFQFNGEEVTVVAFLFLAYKEVAAFSRSQDEFYDLIELKDPIRFNQIE